MSTNYPLSPLVEAQNSGRPERQALIADYERIVGCRLIVLIGEIFSEGITFLEDLIYDADPDENMHLMLVSPGGDGEAAVRLARSMQARCKELTVIVPTEAKSAATLLALGAHHIVMAPFSDLGPVDPQLWDGENLVAAKDLVAAVDDAVQNVLAEPATAPIFATLLADLTSVAVQEARAALNGSYSLLGRALLSNPHRGMGESRLYDVLKERLIDSSQTHNELFSSGDAQHAGLSIVDARLNSEEWSILWRLWATYFTLGPDRIIYESRNVSHILGPSP